MKSLPKVIEEESLKQIVLIAKEMLEGRRSLIKGSRDIFSLYHQTAYSDDDIFGIFVLVSDDTDGYPIDDKIRKMWNQKALASLDKEQDEYIKDMSKKILKGCAELINKFSENPI